MAGFLEAWLPGGRQLVVLDEGRVTVGKDPANSLVLEHDGTVSRLHAALEPYGPAWVIRDLGSRNGTYVNGERIVGDRVLHDGDDIRVGSTRLSFRSADSAGSATAVGAAAPQLTPRERDVLCALCRPLFSGQPFPQPASTREIAAELVVSDAAVKQHLLHLYDKFGIFVDDGNRRLRLANEAIVRGAVTPAQLQASPGE
jgi:DNA-binding CsgD family transcriptional regulator